MSETVLEYAPVAGRRPSRAAKVSVALAALAHLLFLSAIVCYHALAMPAYHAHDHPTYRFFKLWFTILPAWLSMALAAMGVVLAIVALAKPGRSRKIALVALVLSLADFAWLPF
jgi:hypothetical protein